jgi:hypothetical protein
MIPLKSPAFFISTVPIIHRLCTSAAEPRRDDHRRDRGREYGAAFIYEAKLHEFGGYTAL